MVNKLKKQIAVETMRTLLLSEVRTNLESRMNQITVPIAAAASRLDFDLVYIPVLLVVDWLVQERHTTIAMMMRRRLLLSVLALSPLLAQSWNTRRETALSEFSLEILGQGRFLDQTNYYNYDAEINEKCSEYLVSFLEGTTDAKDTCEGIQNAYTAANCDNLTEETTEDDQDDYFGQFYEHKCCQSLLNRYSEYCDDSQLLSNEHLLLAASVLLLCEVAKSFIKSYDIHWLPEAGVCIIVGTLFGIIGHLIPGLKIDDLSFDGELFLSVLLPPIIFEAALSVSKKDFRRRRLAIFMFAVVGTLLSTFMTGTMVHWASRLLKSSTDIPILDCVIYGALISSIDPVAILSVLTSLNMSQSDTVFILVLGESLLNDGVAITLSQNLSTKFGQGSMTVDEVFGTIADFLIIAFGSMFVGFGCAILCMLYFWVFGKMLNPGMEVGSFFLWALIPYWICDGLEWSGIVSIVTMGFFMDVYVASPQEEAEEEVPVVIPEASLRSLAAFSNVTDTEDSGSVTLQTPSSIGNHYTRMEDRPTFHDEKSVMTFYSNGKRVNPESIYRLNILRLLIHRDRIRLSEEADKHVRFVAHLLAQLSENAIFAYLGLFLFSGYYEWDAPLVTISVIICIVSRFLMVVIICNCIWYINILRRGVAGCGYENETNVSRTATQLRSKSTQVVLMWAGLRGAVSLALVENIPLYNNVTKAGCEFKPVLKAMTSATIIFTTFFFGGSAYYVFPMLGVRPDTSSGKSQSSVSAEEPYDIKVADDTPVRRNRQSQPEAEMRNMSSRKVENAVMA